MNIILASQSPIRKKMLENLGLKFRIVPSGYEEDMTLRMKPAKLVAFLAKNKAENVAQKFPADIVVGADTIYAYGNKVFGKPKDKKDAKQILRSLSGKTILVMTGLAVMCRKEQKSYVKTVVTKMKMKKMSEKEIHDYVLSGEPMGKAGAHAIQGRGSALVEWVSGEPWNITGVPVYALSEILKKFGISVVGKS